MNSTDELLARLTTSEIIEYLFKGVENKCDFFGEVFNECFKQYEKDNPIIEQAVQDIITLEVQNQHVCDVTRQAIFSLRMLPMSSVAVKQLVELIKEHVNEKRTGGDESH